MLEILGAAGNAIGSIAGSLIQNELGKSNEKRQWNEYYSPQAQVRNLAAAGINPAVAMGNQSPVLTAGGQMQMPDVPGLGLGTTALSEIGAYLQAKQMAAKTEKETGKVDAETKKILSELDAQNLQNDLIRQFGRQSWTYDISQKYENILLARKTNDIKEQEKAINEFRNTTEYMESQLKGAELTAFKKRLANLDTEIQLSNKLQTEKIATEKSSQTANYAAADSSKAQAALHRSNTKYQDIVNDIKESGKVFELENIIQNWRKENKVNSYQYENAKFWLRRMSRLNKQLSGESLKSKIEQELDDFFWYWKDEVPNIEMPTFMIPLK